MTGGEAWRAADRAAGTATEAGPAENDGGRGGPGKADRIATSRFRPGNRVRLIPCAYYGQAYCDYWGDGLVARVGKRVTVLFTKGIRVYSKYALVKVQEVGEWQWKL